MDYLVWNAFFQEWKNSQDPGGYTDYTIEEFNSYYSLRNGSHCISKPANADYKYIIPWKGCTEATGKAYDTLDYSSRLVTNSWLKKNQKVKCLSTLPYLCSL